MTSSSGSAGTEARHRKDWLPRSGGCSTEARYPECSPCSRNSRVQDLASLFCMQAKTVMFRSREAEREAQRLLGSLGAS